MLLNFKSSHLPHHTGPHLCKCENGYKFYYKVLHFQKESKIWLKPNTLELYKGTVISWVKIREKKVKFRRRTIKRRKGNKNVAKR